MKIGLVLESEFAQKKQRLFLFIISITFLIQSIIYIILDMLPVFNSILLVVYSCLLVLAIYYKKLISESFIELDSNKLTIKKSIFTKKNDFEFDKLQEIDIDTSKLVIIDSANKKHKISFRVLPQSLKQNQLPDFIKLINETKNKFNLCQKDNLMSIASFGLLFPLLGITILGFGFWLVYRLVVAIEKIAKHITNKESNLK